MKRTISHISYAVAALAPDGAGFAEAAAPSGYWPGALFAMAFGVGNVNRVLVKWENDGAYQKEALDERNIAINILGKAGGFHMRA